MKIFFDTEKLQQVADDFFYATGIGIYIIAGNSFDMRVRRTKGNPYCHAIRSVNEGKKRCECSDELLFEKCQKSQKPEIHVCHGGLVNIAAPIVLEGDVVGYVFFYSLRAKAFDEVCGMVADLNVDEKELRCAYEEVPEFREERFNSAVNLAVMLIEHVLLDGMIKPSSDDGLERVKEYIKKNLSGDLSVKAVSRGTNVSKSVIYRLFSKYCGCTLSEYVNKKRVQKAEKLLLETELSLSKITEMVGYNSETYFRMSFKKINGISPLKFRKAANKNV
jgi:ligand-binding sensor protein